MCLGPNTIHDWKAMDDVDALYQDDGVPNHIIKPGSETANTPVVLVIASICKARHTFLFYSDQP